MESRCDDTRVENVDAYLHRPTTWLGAGKSLNSSCRSAIDEFQGERRGHSDGRAVVARVDVAVWRGRAQKGLSTARRAHNIVSGRPPCSGPNF